MDVHRRKLRIYLAFLLAIFPFNLVKAQNGYLWPMPDAAKILKRNVNDTARCKSLLILGMQYLYRLGSEKKDIDSALFFIDQALALSNSIHNVKLKNRALLLKGDCYLESGNINLGTPYFMEVIKYYHGINNKIKEGQTWERFGDCVSAATPEQSEFKNKLYNHAITIYNNANDRLRAITTLKRIADAHLNSGKVNQAETELLEVVKKLKAIRYTHLQYTYDLLAAAAKLQGDLKKELHYRIEVVRTMEETHDSRYATVYYVQLAETYNSFGKYERADYYYQKALKLMKTSLPYYFYQVVFDFSGNLLVQHKAREALAVINNAAKIHPPAGVLNRIFIYRALGFCYKDLGQLNFSDRYCYKLTKLLDSAYRIKNLPAEDYFENYLASIDLQISEKKFLAASKGLKKLLAVPVVNIALINVGKYELMRYKVDSAYNNDHSALIHYKRYTQLKDSIFSVEKTRQFDAIEYKFETEKKDKALLIKSKNITELTKSNLLQDARVREISLTRDLTAAGLVLLAILFGAGYNRYKFQRRSNRMLEQKQSEIDFKNQSLRGLNKEQQELLKEKEWLLKEIHHRVKNNLQMSMSLLNMQSSHIYNKKALAAIKDSQRRMHAMSLIHQRLYQSENMALIEMDIYIRELVLYLQDSFGNPVNVKMEISVSALQLDVAVAIPLGLIINECITNSFKYAFPGSRPGLITVKLKKMTDTDLKLTVADNGIGFERPKLNSTDTSLGIKLMNGLSEQLDGKLLLENKNGTCLSLSFSNARFTSVEPKLY